MHKNVPKVAPHLYTWVSLPPTKYTNGVQPLDLGFPEAIQSSYLQQLDEEKQTKLIDY